jgi:hypothetical protein
MEHGVTDADAEICIQNMLVVIEKKRKEEAGGNKTVSPPTYTQPIQASSAAPVYGSFPSLQEMYNHAANEMIVKKLSNAVVKQDLVAHGVSNEQADLVIKNMMDQVQKNKPAEANAKRSQGKTMILVGVLIAGVGAVLAGTNFKIAGDTYAFTYGILAIGAVLFFRGLFKMF